MRKVRIACAACCGLFALSAAAFAQTNSLPDGNCSGTVDLAGTCPAPETTGIGTAGAGTTATGSGAASNNAAMPGTLTQTDPLEFRTAIMMNGFATIAPLGGTASLEGTSAGGALSGAGSKLANTISAPSSPGLTPDSMPGLTQGSGFASGSGQGSNPGLAPSTNGPLMGPSLMAETTTASTP
jgi:hypothetical protein